MKAFGFGLLLLVGDVAAAKKFASSAYFAIVTFGFVQELFWAAAISLATVAMTLAVVEVSSGRIRKVRMTKPAAAKAVAVVTGTGGNRRPMTPLKADILDILSNGPRYCGQIARTLVVRGWDERVGALADVIRELQEDGLIEPGPLPGQLQLTDAGRMVLASLNIPPGSN
jgi:hypothetical protein